METADQVIPCHPPREDRLSERNSVRGARHDAGDGGVRRLPVHASRRQALGEGTRVP